MLLDYTKRCFRVKIELGNRAILIISYRQGPAADGPAMFAVAGDELLNQARLFDMDIVLNIQNDDMYNRTEVRWKTVVLKRLD